MQRLKKMKRLLALFIIIAICFAFITGCNKESDGADDALSVSDAGGDAVEASPSVDALLPSAASDDGSETGEQGGADDDADKKTPDLVPSPEGSTEDTAPDSQEPEASETAETSAAPETMEPSDAADSAPPEPSASETIVEESPSSSPAPPEASQPPDSPEPSATSATPDGPVVLTIFGGGVSAESEWSLKDLQSMRDGYREYTYSTTNNWPRYGHTVAHGVSLPYLLQQAGINANAAGLKLTATDGYYALFTLDQVFGARYAYSSHSASGSSGAVAVEPVIAWEWGEGSVRPENIRSFFGQSGPCDVNTSSFVQNVCKIEVLTNSPGSWSSPEASIASGSVSPETELNFIHDSMDVVKIYYTLDGSEPSYNSAVYNPSTSYFQPELTVPIILQESVTVKAFAAAYGKDRSAVVVFEFVVES